MKLEAGKSYKMRNGDFVKLRESPGLVHPYVLIGDNNFFYTEEGKLYTRSDSEHDIASELYGLEDKAKTVELVRNSPENPPAFACAAGTPNEGHLQEGMTLRDYFAIRFAVKMYVPGEDDGLYEEISNDAYDFADAMLKVRQSCQ